MTPWPHDLTSRTTLVNVNIAHKIARTMLHFHKVSCEYSCSSVDEPCWVIRQTHCKVKLFLWVWPDIPEVCGLVSDFIQFTDAWNPMLPWGWTILMFLSLSLSSPTSQNVNTDVKSCCRWITLPVGTHAPQRMNHVEYSSITTGSLRLWEVIFWKPVVHVHDIYVLNWF